MTSWPDKVTLKGKCPLERLPRRSHPSAAKMHVPEFKITLRDTPIGVAERGQSDLRATTSIVAGGRQIAKHALHRAEMGQIVGDDHTMPPEELFMNLQRTNGKIASSYKILGIFEVVGKPREIHQRLGRLQALLTMESLATRERLLQHPARSRDLPGE